MRILFVVGAYPPADKHGGPAITNHFLAKALKSMGHDVFVLTTDINGTERLNITRGDTQWETVGVRYCRWIKCPLPIHSPELGRELSKRGADFDIALISSSWTSYGLSAGRSCRKANLPYIMYSHGSYAPARIRRGWLKKKLFWWIFDKHLYDQAAAVVALTGAEESQLRNMGVQTPITVIPNGVQADNLSPHSAAKELYRQFGTLRDRPFVIFEEYIPTWTAGSFGRVF